MIRHARLFTAAALAFVAAAAFAQVTVKDAWVRPTIGAATATGGYFEITSARAAKLVGVQTPVAPSAELHEMKMDGDVMRMRAIDAVPLPAGQAVTFKPNGLHVMITGLKAPLKAGDSVPLTLVVEGTDGKRERVEVKAAVR